MELDGAASNHIGAIGDAADVQDAGRSGSKKIMANPVRVMQIATVANADGQ